MKFLNTILVTGFLLMAPAAAQAEETQDYSRENLYKTCEEGILEQEIENFDKAAYCGCVTDKLVPHAEALDKDNSEKNRRKAMRDTVPCMDQHLKNPVLRVCEDMNYEMAAEGQPIQMNCECYYKKVVDNFVETYAEGGALDDDAMAKQAERAQKAMMACAVR